MHKIYRLKRVTEAVLECGLPLDVLAKRINKPHATLMRELNPYDENAKLGLSTLLDIMMATGDPRPLLIMAEEFGLTLAARSMPAPGKSAHLAEHF